MKAALPCVTLVGAIDFNTGMGFLKEFSEYTPLTPPLNFGVNR